MSSRSTASGPRTRHAAAVAALALGLALIACGEDSEEPADEPTEVVDISGTEPVGEETAGSVAPLVQCRDWNRATAPQRLATIADIRSQINLEDPGIDAAVLTDEEATAVFDNACEEPWAQGYRLYLLYARAAGFAPLARELDD